MDNSPDTSRTSTTTSLVFLDGDVPLAGRLHTPAGRPPGPRPLVVVVGSWLTVKEQMADGYAAALAQRGWDCFTFDYAGFGASGGVLPQAEIPARKVANLAAAVRFASSLSTVRPDAVAVVAVCASAQYALAAASSGVPIASFASVAGWFHDTASIGAFLGGTDGVATRLARAEEATEAYLASGEVRLVPAYAPGDDRAGMFIELDYYADAARGAVPQWRNEMAELTWSHWLRFDGIGAVGPVGVPSLFVHSDDCVFPDNIRTVAKRLAGPVRVEWGDGAQVDFYDRPAQMGFALDAIDEHLGATLGAR